MNKDSRITIGIALLYVLYGIINLFGQAQTFAPPVFIDSFLLAFLSLAFIVLPPFKKRNLFLLLFFVYFVLQGCFNTHLLQHLRLEIANQFLLLLTCTGFYIHTFWLERFQRIAVLPFLFFLATIGLRYAEASPLVITGVAVMGALWQVYILARPDLGQRLDVLAKRFYLIMILSVFFDAVYQLFLYLNFSQQGLG